MKVDDLEFEKRYEYDPFSDRADKLGMKPYWRALHFGVEVAFGNTKAECRKDAKRYIDSCKKQ